MNIQEKYENYLFSVTFRNSLQTDPNECEVPKSFDEFEEMIIDWQIHCYQEGKEDFL